MEYYESAQTPYINHATTKMERTTSNTDKTTQEEADKAATVAKKKAKEKRKGTQASRYKSVIQCMHHQSQTLTPLLYPITAQKAAKVAREKRQLQKEKENARIMKQMEQERGLATMC